MPVYPPFEDSSINHSSYNSQCSIIIAPKYSKASRTTPTKLAKAHKAPKTCLTTPTPQPTSFPPSASRLRPPAKIYSITRALCRTSSAKAQLKARISIHFHIKHQCPMRQHMLPTILMFRPPSEPSIISKTF